MAILERVSPLRTTWMISVVGGFGKAPALGVMPLFIEAAKRLQLMKLFYPLKYYFRYLLLKSFLTHLLYISSVGFYGFLLFA